MDLYIRNNNYEIVKVIRNAESVIWQKSYNDVGQCAFTIPVSADLLDVIINGYYITRDDDDMVCTIEQITIQTNSDTNVNYYQVVGLDILNFLNRRIIWTKETYNGNVETAIRLLITNNCITTMNYGGANRIIPNLQLDEVVGFTDTFEKEFNYDNVLTMILSLCQQYDYGIKAYVNNGTIRIKLYRGVDHSSNQTTNPYVTFSDANHNLKTTSYLLDSSSYKNTARVASKEVNNSRVFATVNDSNIGLNRYETFVDASSLDTINTNQLEEQGRSQLSSLGLIETFNGDVYNTNLYKYKTDFDVGDVVIISNNLGITKNTRIKVVKESYDINGYDVTISFND